MTQKDEFVQKAALQFAIFNYLKDLNEEKDPDLINVYIYLLTGLLYGQEISTRKYFVEECDGIKLLFNLLIIEINNVKNTKRLLKIYNEIVKEVNESLVNGGNKLRKFAINQIYELNLHHRFASMLIDYNYSNENNCDIIHLIFSIIYNLTELFMDNPNELFDEIKKMGKLKDESNLDKEEKKTEKNVLIDIIKNIKTKMNEIYNGGYIKGKNNDIETKKLGIKIQ